MRSLTSCWEHICFAIILLILKTDCKHCNGGVCDFDNIDSDGSNYISFDELIRFISRNPDLDKEAIVETIITHGKTFYQNDFNDDGQLSKFEWNRGGEVISVLGRLLTGNVDNH